MNQPEQHVVRVRIASDAMTELMFEMPAPFEPVELTVTLSEGDALRPIVIAAVEPYIESWLQQTHLPYDAFQPPLAIGDGDASFELGQGFAIDAGGRARATYSLGDEPFGNLLRGFERQLIPSDPHDVRVLLRIPGAGVGGAGWESFEAGVKWFFEAWITVGGVYASFDALPKIVEKFRRATDVLMGHKKELEAHGFAPPDPVRLAAARRWTLSELAEALGTTAEEAADLLDGFGFVRDEGGTWRSPAELSKELAMIFLTALTGYEAIQRDEAALSQRLKQELDAWIERQGERD